jgi:asparagine synthase (glutamine-hydrolysing)
MCGIAGELDWRGGRREPSAIAAMIRSLAHRGPEGRTSWFSSDGKLALGHAQLSFFKGAEAQPVANRRGTISVVCNGEIYNHRELAQLVRDAGIECDVRSDVEVIPYLFEWRGVGSFALLRGEFAFALYDSQNRSLYLVRDRFGIKPLYYYAAGSLLLFASEAKALFADPRVPRMLDHDSLGTKLVGITLPGSTAFSKIMEVKPGSYLVSSENGASGQPYWSIKWGVPTRRGDGETLSRDFLGVFDEAVRLRLQGDYPVGVYLSGGIDSSAVLASMVHGGAPSLKAFTIAFDDRVLDESRPAFDTASRLGVEHHVLRVRHRDIAENFRQSLWHSEIPVINAHGTAKFLLSRAASSHVKAIMTGEGADELFAGYPYFGANAGSGQRHGAVRQIADWSRLLWSRQFGTGFLSIPRAGDIAALVGLFGSAPHIGQRALFYARFVRPHLSRDFLHCFSPVGALQTLAADLRSHQAEPMTLTNVDRFLALKYDLPAYILNFLADRQEMAHSIEGRVPFLDDNVVEFASALGEEALTGEWGGKRLIRRAFSDRLPAPTLASRKKIFFAPPRAADEILRSEWAHHLLSREVTEAVGIFSWKRLVSLRMVLNVASPRWGAGAALRSLLILIVSVHALHDLFVVGGSRN